MLKNDRLVCTVSGKGTFVHLDEHWRESRERELLNRIAEIADEFGISRAAVHDSLKSAEKSLQEYEQKLKLVDKFMETNEAIRKIDEMIDRLAEAHGENSSLVERLEEIKSVINGLEDV